MATPLTLEQLVSLSDDGAIIGSVLRLVEDITEDSRKVRPGSLFVARRGDESDGRLYAEEALRRGAAAVLCQRGDGVTVEPRIEVGDLRLAWGVFAQAIFGNPSRQLKLIAITGTNGKTTVASLVSQALEHLGRATMRGGTLGFFLGDERLSDSLTTPMPDQMARLLEQAVGRGTEFGVIEVSSHALSQKRIAGLSFEVVAFTNLSQDHLDYHGTLDAYAAEKARLFSEYTARAQVFNLDDSTGAKWASRFSSLRSTIGVTTSYAPGAGIYCESPAFGVHGTSSRIHDRGAVIEFHSPLLGRHNLENLLVAWGILRQLGFEGENVAAALARATGVPGRLERCETSLDDIVVVVDYAHTPDALDRALSTLRDLGFSEVTCVFGCGGDRDRTKRPLMGQAVARLADRIFVTSDNPRTEDPQAILDDILPGLSGSKTTPRVVVDRRSAILEAITSAAPESSVLVAGKGHEDYQIKGTQKFHFDDREEARRALAVRRELASTNRGAS